MRLHVRVLLAAVLVLVAGYVVFNIVFSREVATVVTLLDVDGEVVRTNSLGHSDEPVVGSEVSIKDVVEVGEESRAILGVGADTRLTLEASSALKVIEVERTGVRVELENGRVSARVRPGSPALSVQARGRAVSANDAAFTMASDGEGAVAVELLEGEVSVQGFDGQEVLGAGQRISALTGRQAVVQQVPDDLLLEVNWPTDEVTRAPDLPLEGRTTPYAKVRVGGGEDWQELRAGADGHFRARVPLSEGENRLTVEVRDVMGQQITEDSEVMRDSTAPSATSTEVLWGR